MIFADTSWFGALLNQRDNRHDDALALLRRHRDETILTSNHVRGESWTFLRRRAGHRVAVSLLDMLASPRVQVFRVEHGVKQEALGWLRRHDEREYSFVDATSFALMRSCGIGTALAFDDDFAAAGFVELRP